jgi:hypothetical protein
VSWCRDIVGWLDVEDILVLRFEDVTGLHGERAQVEAASALARFLDEGAAEVTAALRRSVGRETKTYSGRYSTLDGVWSDRTEALFEQTGATELNRLLGYLPAGDTAIRSGARR